MERKRRIMEAAKECIAEVGHSVSISSIAKQAGVAKGLFFYYFQNKDELVESIAAEISERYIAELSLAILAAPPVDRMNVILRHHLDFIKTRPSEALFLYNSARKPGSDKTLHQPGVFYHNLFLLIREAIEAGIGAGAFRDVDAEEHAYVFLASLHGLGRLKLFDYIREYDVAEHLTAFYSELLSKCPGSSGHPTALLENNSVDDYAPSGTANPEDE